MSRGIHSLQVRIKAKVAGKTRETLAAAVARGFDLWSGRLFFLI